MPSLKPMPVTPEWLKAMPSPAKAIGVDREKKIIRGYVVAERGPFKSEGRGEFDDASLASIVQLGNANPQGLKSRFAHPTMSDDGLGKFLGRSRDLRLDGPRVRADLHLSDAAFASPAGDLGTYLMDLAESDPGALSSSLVLTSKKEERLDAKGKTIMDEAGKPLPPLWRPIRLHASDIVDDGDAVHGGLLSADALPDAMVRKGAEMLNNLFAGQTREVVLSRCTAWLNRYLDERYGESEEPMKGMSLKTAERTLDMLKRLG